MIRLIKAAFICFFLFACSQASDAQIKTVTGTVTDSLGNPLTGATVTVKNSKTVTLTDLQGKFSIEIPPTAKALLVNYVGMVPREIALGSNSSFNISLQAAG